MAGSLFLCWRCGWRVDRCRSSRQLWPLGFSLGDAVHRQGTHCTTECEELSVPQMNDKAVTKPGLCRQKAGQKNRDGPANDSAGE